MTCTQSPSKVSYRASYAAVDALMNWLPLQWIHSWTGYLYSGLTHELAAFTVDSPMNCLPLGFTVDSPMNCLPLGFTVESFMKLAAFTVESLMKLAAFTVDSLMHWLPLQWIHSWIGCLYSGFTNELSAFRLYSGFTHELSAFRVYSGVTHEIGCLYSGFTHALSAFRVYSGVIHETGYLYSGFTHELAAFTVDSLMELATSKATSFTDKPTQPAHQLFSALDQNCLGHNFKAWELITNRQFLEITGKDNLTVFSYSGRMKSPEGGSGEEPICDSFRSSGMDLL